MPSTPRVALAHHWLIDTRGGERVLEAIAELFPAADVHTLVWDRSNSPPWLRARKVRASLLQYFPRATRWYRYYLPFFPLATGRLDLSDYDLVISSDSATMKGVRTGKATHICYCHSPMRYVWTGYQSYRQAAGPLSRLGLASLQNRLRRWDFDAAQRVTHFVANSQNVQKRIRDCYNRDSHVIYPPVDTARFVVGDRKTGKQSFLMVSRLVSYKRVDLLVDAFNSCKRSLTIIGDGPERRRLEGKAGASIRFLGAQPDSAVVEAMQQCDAFVFAGEEDFGIVMAEAQACGKPVIALGKGGAPEIVEHGVTGILFEEESVESILDALGQFDRMAFDAAAIRASSVRFGRKRFLREFSELVAARTGLQAGEEGINF